MSKPKADDSVTGGAHRASSTMHDPKFMRFLDGLELI